MCEIIIISLLFYEVTHSVNYCGKPGPLTSFIDNGKKFQIFLKLFQFSPNLFLARFKLHNCVDKRETFYQYLSFLRIKFFGFYRNTLL